MSVACSSPSTAFTLSLPALSLKAIFSLVLDALAWVLVFSTAFFALILVMTDGLPMLRVIGGRQRRRVPKGHE
jgi:hypothetical protein